MFKVLINAASVKTGGPLVLLRRALPALADSARGDFSIATIIDPAIAPALNREDFGEIIAIDKPLSSAVRAACFYELTLPKLVRQHSASILFSMTNYLPSRAVQCKTMLLVQHAGYFDEIFEWQQKRAFPSAWDRASWLLKKRRVYQSVSQADLVTVQNEDLAEKISKASGRPASGIHVCHHGPGIVAHRASVPAGDSSRFQTLRIGCFSTPGVQKNLGVVLRAVKALIDSGLTLNLVTTLGGDSDFRRAILRDIHQLGLSEIVEDHAHVRAEDMQPLYDSLHMFVWPSLCESFGFPLVEALARGLPCLASDTATNRYITGGCCPRFPPESPGHLAAAISQQLRVPGSLERLAFACQARGMSFSWSKVGMSWADSLRLLHQGAYR